MSGFVVQPGSFPPTARQLRAVGEQVTSRWAPVRAQSVAVRFGRGDDLLSPLIQVSLEAAVALVDECITSCAQALAEFAEGLELMGRNYQETDDAATALFETTGGQ